MAAENRLLSEVTRQPLVDQLTCPRCLKRYGESERRAKLLTCLHGFCLGCLAELVRNSPELKCPVCRLTTHLPAGGVHGLPDNFTAKTLTENCPNVDLTGSSDLYCGSCIADEGPAISFCSDADCLCFLCQVCDEAHRKMRKFKDHIVWSMEDLQKRTEKHGQESLSLEGEKCQEVCSSCLGPNHSSHNVVDLEKTLSDLKAELQSLASAVRGKRAPVCLISGQIQTEIGRTNDLFEERSAEALALFGSLNKLLQNRQSAVIAEMKVMCVGRMGYLKHLADRAESLAAQFDSACKLAETACKIGHPVNLVKASGQTVARLRELDAIDVNSYLPFQSASDTFLSFGEDRHQIVSDFNDLLLRLRWLKERSDDAALPFKLDFPGRVGSSPLPANATHKVRLSSGDPACSFDCLLAYLRLPDGSTTECTGGQKCGGSYEFEFRTLKAGLHQLNISISGVPIKGSPFPVNIEESPPLMSTVTRDDPPQSDTKLVTDVTWKDAFAKCEHDVVVKLSGLGSLPAPPVVTALFSMGDSSRATHDPRTSTDEAKQLPSTEAQVTPIDENGSFRIVYTPPFAGKLNMSVFTDGVPIPNSPFVIKVDPLHPDSTVVSTRSLGKCPLNTAVLDMPYALNLKTHDHLGKPLTSGGYSVTAEVQLSSSSELLRTYDVEDNQDGSYTVTIKPRVAKCHHVRIKICGIPMKAAMPLVISVQESLPFEDPPGGYKAPSGMAVDISHRNSILVADCGRLGCQVYRLEPDGNFESVRSLDLDLQLRKKMVLEMAVTKEGKLAVLVPYYKRVVTCDAHGKLEDRWSCTEDNIKPVSIILTPTDHVIIGDSHSQRLYVHQNKGEIFARIELPKGSLAVGAHNVCLDRSHEESSIIVVMHSEPYHILRYTINGALVSKIDSPATTAQLAAVSAPEGVLIVSVEGRLLVLAFTPQSDGVSVVKEFQTRHTYTRLAVTGDRCFAAFNPTGKHLVKYSYFTAS
ncbi:uncharacterized protein LOC110978119 isoform X2 [Acanthaster planci]|uniref:Uncharacterized protein LOC110978119 isoform X2 n=1 Tax=Acanthaster planci TaxID=133434 RepID=A0A8B7YA23_ACAPL|nr:uncharacterized protein LOC110978119 isoform X2 [Acanthaster planci]